MPQRKADQNAGCGRERHGEQQSDKSEQVTEGEEREHQPDRMQVNAVTDELRLQNVAFNELPDEEDTYYDRDPHPVRPELGKRDTARDQEPGHRADVRNETEQAGAEADQEGEVQADKRQRHRVEAAEENDDEGLAANEPGKCIVDLAREPANGFAMADWKPRVHLVDHAVPIDEDIEGHDRHDDDDGEKRYQRAAAGPEALDECTEPRRTLRHEFADRLAEIHRVAADELSHPFLIFFRENHILQARDVLGKTLDEREQLAAQQRHDQHDDNQKDHGKHADHKQRGEQPVQTVPFEPIGKRVEKISERHAGDEWQQYVAEDPQADDQGD